MKELGGQDLGCLPAVPSTPKANHREVDHKRQKWSPHRLGAETLGDAFMHDRSFVNVVPPVSVDPVVDTRVAVDPDMMSILLGIQNNTLGLNQRLDENQQVFTD